MVHAARFDGRAAFQTLQTGDLLTLLGDGLLQRGNFAEQFNQQRFKLWTAQIGEGRWRWHVHTESYPIEPGQAKNEWLPTLLPLLLTFCLTHWNIRFFCVLWFHLTH